MNTVRFIATVLLAALAVAGLRTKGDAPQSSDDPFAEPPFLAVDEAFVLSTEIVQGRLVARWQMAAGYYLYRHAFALEADAGVTLGALDIPRGQRIVDDYFGESEVYYEAVAISTAIDVGHIGHVGDADSTTPRSETATVTARLRYQGCADRGLCYPPQERTIAIDVGDVGRGGPEAVRIVR